MNTPTPTDLKSFIVLITNLFAQLVPLLVGVALIVFFWGIVKFIRSAGSETAREDAKNTLFWGVISLFVMVSLFGIINFFSNDLFGSGWSVLMVIPKFPIFSN